MSLSLLYWGAQNWKWHSGRGLTSGEKRGRILLSPAVSALPNAAKGPTGHLYGKGTFMIYVWCGVYQKPWSFFAELLPPGQPPGYSALFLPEWRTWHFSLLNYLSSLSAHFNRLSRNLWMAAQSSYSAAIPPSYTPPAALMRVPSAPSPRSSVKMLNRAGPRTEPRAHHCLLPPAGLRAADHPLLVSAIQLPIHSQLIISYSFSMRIW